MLNRYSPRYLPVGQFSAGRFQFAVDLLFQAGKIKIAKVNIDENMAEAQTLGVRGIPALFMFKDGQVVSNKIGAAPKAALQSWIEEGA